VAEPAGIEKRLTSIESRLDGVESRLDGVESRLVSVATDAAAARYLVAAHDRDLADLGVKVDANRRAINALGEQTAARFDALENKVDTGFAEMRAKFDQTAGGHERIVELLDQVIARLDDD
jgi:tetrahydromethanopterin S-methyltransferase subunit G